MKNTLFTKITKVFLAVLLLFNCVITPATVRGEDSQTVSAITSLSELGYGDKIAIVNKANQKVLSQTYTGNYNAGVDVTITDDTISYPAATEIWTLGITAEGYYQFMTASGSKLSMDTQYASTPLDKVHDTWKVEAVPDAAGLFYITNVGRSQNRLEWYADKNDWSTFTNYSDAALFQQQIYLVEKAPEPGQEVLAESLVLDQETLTVEVGKTAKLTATVSPEDTTDKSLTWTSSDEEVATVDGTGNVMGVAPGEAVITVSTKDGSELTAECAVTVTEPEVPVTYLDKLTAAPADGDTLVILHKPTNNVLSAKASGNKLTGTAGTLVGGRLKLTDDMALMTVKVTDGKYEFVNSAGLYLTSTGTGNNLSFATQNSNYSKWTLSNHTDGTWALTNAGANYNGNYNQALEYYNSSFTTYGIKLNNDAYKFDFYALQPVLAENLELDKTELKLTEGESGQLTASILPADTTNKLLEWTSSDEEVATVDENGLVTAVAAGTTVITAATTDGSELTAECTVTVKAFVEDGLITDLSVLEDGDLVVVYNENGKYAMSNTTLAQFYRGLETVTIENDKVVDPPETAMWTLGIKTAEDGTVTYTFTTQDGHVLSAGTRNSLPLDDVNQEWRIEAAAAENSFYIINTGRPTQYIEYYGDKSEFSAYKYQENQDAIYLMKLYKVTKSTTPVEPDEQSYGLVQTLNNEDKIIIFNDAYKSGLSSTPDRYYLAGVSLTPADKIIKTDNEKVVWDVIKNADGTYTFTQGDKTLGGIQTTDNQGRTVYNLVTDGTGSTKFTLENDKYLYLGEFQSAKTGGHIYLEWHSGQNAFTLYDYANPGTDTRFIFSFYKQGAEPEEEVIGDLVTDLSKLENGTPISIYSKFHKTAVSSKPNGDWYLKANSAEIENGSIKQFTSDFVFRIYKNDDGTYTFVSNDNENQSIAVWRSDNNNKTYAEVTVNSETYPENKWVLTPAKTENCYYISNPSVTDDEGRAAYLEAFVRNGAEVYSGYFTNTSSSKFTENEFALQFYLVDPDKAVEGYDDGEWDGVLQKGESYVMYAPSCGKSLGLFKEANHAFDAIDTTISSNKAIPGNGAYVFKIDTMGRYYSFEVNGQYMASNEQEELIFVEKDANGKLPENAKWYLKPIGDVYKDTPAYDGYVVFNKDAAYNGSNVCIEYYSSVFSGWTFKASDHSIFIFQFYKVGDDVQVYDDTVQDPSVVFNCVNMRHLEEDFHVSLALDDLAEDITDIKISYQVGDRVVNVEDYEVTSDKKGYTFDLAAADIDKDEKPTSFTILVDVTNSYGISYSGSKTIEIIDAPFFADLTPAPNSQTGEDVRPVISAIVGNVGDAPEFLMRVNDEEVEAVWENGILSYTPAEDMPLGRTTVYMRCTRADNVSEEQYWTFTVGTSDFQLYFGQLHSHTTYSDGAGTLDSALEYIASLPESANIDFVAFTDHSNYFDAETAANPADAMNDPSLMTPASRAVWEEYKGKAADFNASHTDLIAIAGYEMTWSGGPGHINSYNTKGLVSRNDKALNNKNSDAGMKLYYETINKDDGTSLHQFNHPGTTFGNFSNFAYWNEATDARMFLVEVGNGEGQIGAGGYYPSYEQYTLALDRGWHLAPTNNQDNHKGRWGNANDARDVVLAENFSEEGIYDAIRALRVYATEDKNFELTYLANGEQMGTVFTEENMPEKFIPEITMYDPDSSDSVKKVELIVDNGAVAYTWNNAEELAKGYLTAELPIEYTYYFVRVTQADGDLIVTAPVWFGSALDLGIEKIAPAAEPLYTNTDITLNTVFFNHEDEQATITSIVYTDGGSKVYATDTTQKTIPANGTLTVDANIGSFDVAKHTNVTVTAVIKCGEKEITVTSDVYLDILDKEAGVSTIKEVREASVLGEEGLVFVIEGVVTSNASGYDKDTAFFDAIYVQDETAGICAFPVSGNFKIGDKVHIVGYTDFYQGEPELQVSSIEVIGEGTVEPTEINATDLNNRSAEGKLVTIKGTVESFEYAEELVQTILVKDNENQIARVFIDGYITTADEVKNLAVGASIEATGLASYDDTWPDVDHFPRIRIRNRADVIITPTEKSFDIEDLPADVIYNGNEQKVNVTVHDTETGTVLTEGTDYEVAYTGDLVNVGTVTVTVTGKGLYTGEIVRTYDISPLAVNVTITGNSGDRIYTGKEQKIEGYTFKADSDLYKEEYVTLDGEAVARGTNASDEWYYMGLTKEKFQNTNNNFTVTFTVTDGYLEIINAELMVKIDDATKVYGDADPEYTVTITNMEGDDTAEKMLAVLKEAGMAFTREEGEDVGTYTVRFADPNLRIQNYNVNPTNGKLTITKKAATLTAEDLAKVYGEADPALKVTTDGVKTGDTLNYTVAREEGEDVGEYRITITLGENPNYEIKTEEGSLKITRKAVTIKVNDASKTAGEADPAFSGTITGLVKEGDLGTVRFVRENTAEEAGVYKDVLNAVYTENGNYDVTVVKGSFEIKEAPLPPVTYTLTRLSGKDRYLTSMKAADELKAVLGVEKFDAVILATGKNFADALGGGYLAARKSAPILLTSDTKYKDINAYINANLKDGGTVYVLGGTAAVSEEALKGINGKVVRLSGKDRYLTNLAILKEAGVTNEDILVCSGNNFADALAASASGRPMLLVNTKKNTLTDGQKEFLASHTANKLYIIGGTGAVSAAIEEEVKTYGTPERVKGATRYETSVEIAKKFFSSPDTALVAFSDDYPDGLCAGPLGYVLKSPILLTKPGKEASLKDYCSSSSITNGYIIGGEARIPDDSARDIFSAPSDTVVVKK